MSKENFGLEKAQILFKLARKDNWGHKYDRLEHFKRFKNLQIIIKELTGNDWIIIYKKSNFTAIALNPKHKMEIVEFIEEKMPYVKGMV